MATGPDPSTAEGGPLLGLLARGLELWLRQQCQAIEDLEIRLEGSAAQLLRGRLAGVGLTARRVTYQNLQLERVELRSSPIRVRMGALLRNRGVELENPFAVRGLVVFSGEGLNRSLAGPHWSGLGDLLAEGLLGVSPLAALRLEADRVVLQVQPAAEAEPLEQAARLAAVEGTLELQALAGPQRFRLPMDPAIRIERASVAAGLLELEGEAQVSP